MSVETTEAADVRSAAGSKDWAAIKELLIRYGNVNAGVCVVAAARDGNLSIIQWIIENITFRPHECALSVVMAPGKWLPVLTFLEDNYPDVEQCAYDFTALLHAASSGHLNIVQWLIGQCRGRAQLAAEIAGFAKHFDVVRWLLIEGGARASDRLWRNMATRVFRTIASIPTDIMHLMLLQRSVKPMVIAEITILSDNRHKTFIESIIARANILRWRRPEWDIEKNATVFDAAKLITPLVQLVLDYSAPSVDEIWSRVVDMDSPRSTEVVSLLRLHQAANPRRNPARTTRKRHRVPSE